AGLLTREECQVHDGRVGEPDRDAVALAHPLVGEHSGELVATAGVVAPRQPLDRIDERGCTCARGAVARDTARNGLVTPPSRVPVRAREHRIRDETRRHAIPSRDRRSRSSSNAAISDVRSAANGRRGGRTAPPGNPSSASAALVAAIPPSPRSVVCRRISRAYAASTVAASPASCAVMSDAHSLGAMLASELRKPWPPAARQLRACIGPPTCTSARPSTVSMSELRYVRSLCEQLIPTMDS